MNKLTFILILLPISFLIGQNARIPQNVPTPNATSLGKYGNTPVNYYTGKVNVTVPIYSLNENNIPLNLSLNYDTGGVRVNELPSWIGQNWNLDAGGVVVRTMKGKAVDELFFDSSWGNSHLAQKGYLYNYNTLNTSNWTDISFLKSLDSQSKHDYEPDVFTFNFLGHTGTFYLSQDGNWKVKSDSNLKVEINTSDNVLTLERKTHCMSCYNNATPPKSIGKITITDENGNKYIFGNNTNAIEYAHNNFFYYASSLTSATAWYLTSVLDRLGNQVYTFEYDRGDYQAYFYLNQMYSKKRKYKNDSFATFLGECVNPSLRSNNIGANLLVPSYLKKITTLGGITINFSRSTSNFKYYTADDADNVLRDKMFEWSSNYDPSSNSYQNDFYLLIHDKDDKILPLTDEKGNGFGLEYLLNKVKLSQLDNITINKDNTTKYVRLIRNSNLNERLNLIRLENGNYFNGSWKPESVYKFEYNNFNSLPYYLSKAIDHWGYYKGTNFGNSFFSNAEASKYSLHGETRNPDPISLQIGSLKKITYPTGGYTQFEFEPHTYSSYVNDNLELSPENDIAGGLRIQKIINFDGTTETSKTLKYTTDIESEVSSGILALKNRYYVEWRTYTEDQSVYLENNFSINNLTPLSNFSGSHISYPKVFEIEQGNGYKEYQYNSYKDYPDTPYTQTLSYSHSIFDEKNSNDFKRGGLKKLTFFNEQKTKLREQINLYQSIGSYKVRAFNYDFICPCCPGIFELVRTGNAYEIEYSDFKQVSSQDISYFNGKGVTTTTNFNYKNYPNSTMFFGDSFLEKEESLLGNVTRSINYYYPFDFSGATESNLLNKHSFPVIESITKTNNEITLKQKNIFNTIQINGKQNEMMLESQKAKSINNYESDVIIDQYDSRGNVIEYHKENGPPMTFIWNLTKTDPIAKIENATNAQVAIAMGVADINNLNESNLDAINTLRSNPGFANTMITTYTYIPLIGVSTITDPKGDKITYTYDFFGRLEYIKDKDLKIVQEYAYKYKKPEVIQYKSIARSGSFTKSNCPPGGTGSSVPFNQLPGAYTSTISQADADSEGLKLFNKNGELNANANGECTFRSITRSGSFTRTNCAPGGIVGPGIPFSQSEGAYISKISQADADSEGLKLFNTNGEALANANGICTFSSIALSGPFERDNCDSDGAVGESVIFSQAAGVETSTISQEDANSKGLARFNKNGRAYARIKGKCTFSSIARSGSFVKNDCLEGEEGSRVNFNQTAGAATSTVSQAAADEEGLWLFNKQGQINANQNGTCTKFITYMPKWNPVNKSLAILATASSSNHNGVTLRFNINYENESYDNVSEPATIFIPAGQTSKGISVWLTTKSSYPPIVQLIAIERN